MVQNASFGDVDGTPAQDSIAKAKFGIVAVGKEILVESAGLKQHGTTEHAGAAVGPEDLLAGVELAVVKLAVSASAVLSIEPDEVAGFVDDGGVFPDEDLGGGHADAGIVEGR